MEQHQETPIVFERIAKEILIANRFHIIVDEVRAVNFIAELNKVRWATEVKYYRSATAQLSLMENAATTLINNAKPLPVEKAMLIVSCYLPPEMREMLEARFPILFVDRLDLTIWAAKNASLSRDLEMVFDDPLGKTTTTDNRSKRTSTTATRKAPQLPKELPEKKEQGAALCKSLDKIESGHASWTQFESICRDALQYLFEDHLVGWVRQNRTDDGLNIFDLVCRVKPASAFWQFIVDQIDSRYVVFEFKNYSAAIKKYQILTTECYLLEKALRKTAIVITRKGADDGAKGAIAGAMREQGKLILVLDDEDICEMLKKKDGGDDPSDYLFKKADDFLLSLSR